MKPARLLLLAAAASLAQAARAEEATLRVIDVGNGLCVVARAPGGTMLYDAGDKGGYCLAAVKELVPSTLDLVVLSHSDADHIGELPAILAARPTRQVIHPGDNHAPITQTIQRARAAIGDRTLAGSEWSLATRPLPEPDQNGARRIAVGAATLTLIGGWADGNATRHADESPLPKAERNNAVSIVARFEYAGHSVLLTGDIVGRLRGKPNTACAYAERRLVADAARWPLKSDVLVGQHHGADNASSNCFIRAVQPTYVVFAAGRRHGHPTQAAADRFMANQVLPDNMLRTDRGDHEEGTGEWIYGSIRGCVDQPGDDDVEITLSDNGPVSVRYRQPPQVCAVRTRAFYRR